MRVFVVFLGYKEIQQNRFSYAVIIKHIALKYIQRHL